MFSRCLPVAKTARLQTFEKWFRHICAALFLILGVYLAIHCVMEYREHDCCGHEHTELILHS